MTSVEFTVVKEPCALKQVARSLRHYGLINTI